MSEEKSKKTKINLKDRLGKTMMGMQSPGALPAPIPGPSMPTPAVGTPIPTDAPQGDRVSVPSPSQPAPPAQTPIPMPRPSVPAARPSGIAPPPGMTASLSPGIPMPPFGPQPRQAPPPAQPKPTAQQQTIKVEIGEEIEQERAKANKKSGIYAGLGAVLGIAIGFAIGQAKSSGDAGTRAVEGAKKVLTDVKAANEKLKELDDKLTAAGQSITEKKFPEDLAAALGAINIPFDETNIEGRGVGNMPAKLQRMVFTYTIQANDLNKKKDSLKNLLGALKDPVTKAWKEEKEPMTNFAVTFRQDGGKVVAEYVPVKDPFKWGATDKDKFTVIKTEQGRPAEKNVARWTKGDLTPSDPVAIPVDPKTAPSATQTIGALSKALYDIRLVLEGNQDDPQNPKSGLMKDGDDLSAELQKAANAH
jgi:hypothetical protein